MAEQQPTAHYEDPLSYALAKERQRERKELQMLYPIHYKAPVYGQVNPNVSINKQRACMIRLNTGEDVVASHNVRWDEMSRLDKGGFIEAGNLYPKGTYTFLHYLIP